MKKTIGTILAVLCLAAALLLGSGTAFAQTAGQWTPREHPQDTIGCVNGAQSDEIIAQADRDLGGCKFTYRGKGKLTGTAIMYEQGTVNPLILSDELADESEEFSYSFHIATVQDKEVSQHMLGTNQIPLNHGTFYPYGHAI